MSEVVKAKHWYLIFFMVLLISGLVVGSSRLVKKEHVLGTQHLNKHEAGSLATPSMSISSQDRSDYMKWAQGYSRDTPLEEAVRDFNIRAQADETGRTQPPLRAEEVLTAIRAWSLTEEPIDLFAFKSFQQIGASAMMPRGSLLDFGKGAEGRNGYDTEAWGIYLYIYLDKYPRDQVGLPNFIRLVRMQYLSSKKAK